MTLSKRPSLPEDTVPNSKHAAETEPYPRTGHEHGLLESLPGTVGYAHGVHPHVHDPESLRRIINRLARIEGHIRGIKTMVQESRPCPDVLVQIAAVRGALDRVARIILDEHLTECISRAAEEGNIEDEIKQLKAALDRFLP
ncbi:MAG: metal-sensitive transcriptional regulator [Cyanobacteria bacterium Co-bin8]|nr:metal-sensitive transcriptional regulator [Cyanobacteria bacterium Co-bin8]